MLWGTHFDDLPQDFTFWRHGAMGHRHALPRPATASGQPPRLLVRHYLAQDDVARVVASRLVRFEE
jgi:hypothetical protein